MKDLTIIEKFDAVLKVLYDISGKRPTFGRITALLLFRKQKVDGGEIWDIIRKMQREFLLHPDIKDSSSKTPNEIIYLITFEGKLMWERNGLAGKMYREKFTKTWITSISILTLVIAALSLYFSLSSVSDSTLNKINESITQGLLKQDSLILLEKNKLRILQNIADSVSGSK